MDINGWIVKVIVPTLNAGADLDDFISALLMQKGLNPADVTAIDSSSDDGTTEKLRQAGFLVKVIRRESFGHGKTRREAVEETAADFLVFLTQDAILAESQSIRKLVEAFDDPTIAAAYGRQLPRPDATPYAAFARQFNYGEKDIVNIFTDRTARGIKTAFFSDSFAAYRRDALLSIGNFDADVDHCEDTIVAAKLLMAGYKTKYCTDAKVYHSHNYGIADEYRRAKATGKLHRKKKWLLETFGQPEGEGWKFVIAEMKYLSENGKAALIPCGLIRNTAKYIGYIIG